MSAALPTQSLLMLRAPWQWGRSDWGWWLFAVSFFWLMLLGVSMTVFLIELPGVVVLQTGLVLSVCLALATWGLQYWALLRLHQAHAACLVPGHRRALRWTALWLALLVMGLSALVGNWVGPNLTHAANPAALASVLAGLVMILVILGIRWPLFGLSCGLLFGAVQLSAPWVALEPVRQLLAHGWTSQPLLITAFALVTTLAVVAVQFGRSSAAGDVSTRVLVTTVIGNRRAPATEGGLDGLLKAPGRLLADVWFRRLLEQARLSQSSVMGRASVVLWGHMHWTKMLWAQISMLLFVFLALCGLSLFADKNLNAYIDGTDVGLFTLGMVLMTISSLSLSMGVCLWWSRPEQALLLLLPGMPQGAALNRALAQQQLAHHVLNWVSGLSGFAVLVWSVGRPEVLGLAGAALPLGLHLLQDHSRLTAPNLLSTSLPFLMGVALGLLSMLLLRLHPGALLPWAIGVVLLTAALLAWRWRQLSKWPQALPAGRLA